MSQASPSTSHGGFEQQCMKMLASQVGIPITTGGNERVSGDAIEFVQSFAIAGLDSLANHILFLKSADKHSNAVEASPRPTSGDIHTGTREGIPKGPIYKIFVVSIKYFTQFA